MAHDPILAGLSSLGGEKRALQVWWLMQKRDTFDGYIIGRDRARLGGDGGYIITDYEGITLLLPSEIFGTPWIPEIRLRRK